jgi:hypothetical protein
VYIWLKVLKERDCLENVWTDRHNINTDFRETGYKAADSVGLG